MDIKIELERLLAEDLGKGDITSQAVFSDERIKARIVPREECILAGIEEASILFGMGDCVVEGEIADGQRISPGGIVMNISGLATEVLSRERLALNIISCMSGVATTTARMVKRARSVNPDVLVAATRKTTPGFRFFEKKAVFLGGGWPHRYRLDHSYMIKDNHLQAAGSVKEAISRSKRARKERFGTSKPTDGVQGNVKSNPLRNPLLEEIPQLVNLYRNELFDPAGIIEVEADTMEGAVAAAKEGAEIVLLDNMDPELAKKSARAVKDVNPNVLIEISGGISEQNLILYAPFADIISSSALTQGQRADFSLEVMD